jgi:hypothetical protein
MTRLEDDEEVTLQLVLRRYASRKASRFYNQILRKGKAKVDGILRYYLLGLLVAVDCRYSRMVSYGQVGMGLHCRNDIWTNLYLH